MTPYQIKLLSDCFCSPTESPPNRLGKETIDDMKAAGLIRADSSEVQLTGVRHFVTTEKGNAHVRQLCDLPFPTKAWLSATGAILDSRSVKGEGGDENS